MHFFEKYFGIDLGGRDTYKVKCPFHDDSVASAVINSNGTFHCFACKEHLTEAQFIARVNGVDISEAYKVLSSLDTQKHQWDVAQKAGLWADSEFLETVRSLGLSDTTIQELGLGLVKNSHKEKFLGFPVFHNKVLMDIRKYNILKLPNRPKMLGEKGSEVGLVVPFDLWAKDKSKTYIFEGEKDMAIARDIGLNAITLTGGASAKPNTLVLNEFKGRNIVICYDNDDAGRNGAVNLYKALVPIAKSVKYIDISQVVPENKGDMYDAVMKYDVDIFTFLDLPEQEFSADIETEENTSVQECLRTNKIKKRLKSLVTISADFADTYAVPTQVTFTKTTEDKNATMVQGETRTWYLQKRNIYNMLELIEIGAREKEVINNIKRWLGIPPSEKGLKINKSGYQTIYKVRVMDANTRVVVNVEEEHSQMTLDLYSYTPLKVGAQYQIEHIIFPHPTKNQKLVAISLNSQEIDDASTFKTDKELLAPFAKHMAVEEKVEYLYNSAKHHIAKHLNKDLWLMSDLVFNSILEFDYGDRIRGALDVFILGDTQVGKSETTSKLTELYNFGHFLSLKTSTTVGLIGGSQKVDNSMLNTIGAIPRQHKKLVVLEEFSGAPASFIKTMTDIRTSGQIRITRIAGELRVPCRLRTLTISNPINDENGNPRYLSTFPNGVAPLMELIHSAEDVARYDGFLLVPSVSKRFNPFNHPLIGVPIPKESYTHKMQWVYSRKPHHVKISDDIKAYIWEKAEELNKEFESNFPLFGTTASLKLARFSVALASLLLSTDDSYENVIVTREIVDYMCTYLRKIYDNDVFKLKDYKREHEEYNYATDKEIENLQKMYARHAVLLDFLLSTTKTNMMTLRVTSGLDGDKFNPVFAQLVKSKFVRLVKQSVEPTPKFRYAMRKIDKSFRADTGKMDVANKGLAYKIGDE
jgi:DNA primase